MTWSEPTGQLVTAADSGFRPGNPTPLPSRASPYTPAMDATRMNELLSLTTPEEIDDGLWFIDVCERNGNMDQAEADE